MPLRRGIADAAHPVCGPSCGAATGGMLAGMGFPDAGDPDAPQCDQERNREYLRGFGL
jgi:hypothetical protein